MSDDVSRGRSRALLIPSLLLAATALSTFSCGAARWMPLLYMDSAQRLLDVMAQHWREGLLYTAAVLGILLTHEMGHFLVAVRYRVPASLPLFIPVPVSPFGTMGAIIAMQGGRADRRQTFDLGIAGPLAGLVIAIPVTCWGVLQWEAASAPASTDAVGLHAPLAFDLVVALLRPELSGHGVLFLSEMNPLLMAGWVGMLVTGLNMLPVSQLDGGHVCHGLIGERSRWVGRSLLVASIAFVVLSEQYGWVLMVVVVTLLGTDHPPTADDSVRLGWPRALLGWLSLSIPVLCLPFQGIVEIGP